MIAEHGLSIMVEAEGRRLLFDTGQGMALFGNLRRMWIAPATIGTCALSHCHYDHTGGLLRLLEGNPDCVLAGHPTVFRRSRSLLGGDHEVGYPYGDPPSAKLRLSRNPLELAPGVMTTGYVPRVTDFESVPGHFVDLQGEPDCMDDDMGLVLDTPDGPALLTGCAHSGVVNMALRARELAGSAPVFVMGGMHLYDEDSNHVARVGEELSGIGVRALFPGHCTGERQVCQLTDHFQVCRRIDTGFTLELNG